MARRVAECAGLEYVELDALYWGPNWKSNPKEAFVERVSSVIDSPSWVIDGNYGVVRNAIWTRAELVIWIDLPFPTIIRQVTIRTFGRFFRGEKLWHGNREQLWKQFLPWDKSLYWWVLKTFRRRRREYEACMLDPDLGSKMVKLRSHQESERLLEALARAVNATD